MAKELFIDQDFTKKSKHLIKLSNDILAEYKAQGFVLTLRQLYYQHVARGHIPNKLQSYKNLGALINHARLAGLVDWAMLEDRTRSLEDLPRWSSPANIMESIAEQYRTDIWRTQPRRVEVWVEKEAMAGIVEPICQELRMPYFCCRGYASQSELWRAGHRIRRYFRNHQKALILHLGDHDPSGIDMTRDNEERLVLFSHGELDYNLEIRRLALNMNQIEEYNPPPNPAKLDDSRYASYADKFGDESWELDALEPQVISDLIRNNTEPEIVNRDEWQEVERTEIRDRSVMQSIANRWDEAVERFGDQDEEGDEEGDEE